MTLDRVKRGCLCRIISMPSEQVRDQCIRLGICEGETVNCCEIVPAGPVVIRKKRQEIAIGRALAKKIAVEEI
ncbi:MAG: iron transporter [Peptococcaceae bacterium BRH_c4b]|nr:MAG: iron transporter [Peptococcaceae bacterium BRH_c4b]